MKFLFRADASWQIGSGHIMRCLTLAHALKKRGHSVFFLCRDLEGHLFDTIQQHGFDGALLPAANNTPPVPAQEHPLPAHQHWLPVTQAQDAADCLPWLQRFQPDWVVVDHYALSCTWHKHIRAAASTRLWVMDDLADRPHDADMLLDQNLGRKAVDYQALLPSGSRILCGPRYALLRPEFLVWRQNALARRQTRREAQHILLNLGGVDAENHTLHVLQALAQVFPALPHALHVTVIMGQNAPHTATVCAYAAQAPYTCQVHSGVSNMAEHMAAADIAIGAAGSTAWERCCMGLPSLLLVLADNQRAVAAALQHHLGQEILSTCERAQWPQQLQAALDRAPEYWQTQSRKAAALCDGRGVERILNNLELSWPPDASLRPARADDCQTVFNWRNHADIRRVMLDTAPLDWTQHCNWFAQQWQHPEHPMLIYRHRDRDYGYMRLQHLGQDMYMWGFYLSPDCPRRQGHGLLLGRLALQYAFGQLGAAAVSAQVRNSNTASLALHRTLGFRQPENPSSTELTSFVIDAQDCLY